MTWGECVAPVPCLDDSAHHDVIHVEVCRCKAVRLTEANGPFQVTGPWVERPPTHSTVRREPDTLPVIVDDD